MTMAIKINVKWMLLTFCTMDSLVYAGILPPAHELHGDGPWHRHVGLSLHELDHQKNYAIHEIENRAQQKLHDIELHKHSEQKNVIEHALAIKHDLENRKLLEKGFVIKHEIDHKLHELEKHQHDLKHYTGIALHDIDRLQHELEHKKHELELHTQYNLQDLEKQKHLLDIERHEFADHQHLLEHEQAIKERFHHELHNLEHQKHFLDEHHKHLLEHKLHDSEHHKHFFSGVEDASGTKGVEGTHSGSVISEKNTKKIVKGLSGLEQSVISSAGSIGQTNIASGSFGQSGSKNTVGIEEQSSVITTSQPDNYADKEIITATYTSQQGVKTSESPDRFQSTTSSQQSSAPVIPQSENFADKEIIANPVTFQ